MLEKDKVLDGPYKKRQTIETVEEAVVDSKVKVSTGFGQRKAPT